MEIPDMIGLSMIILLCAYGVYAIFQNYQDLRYIEDNLQNLTENLEKYHIAVIRVGCKFRFISEKHNRYTDYMMPSDARDFIEEMNVSKSVIRFFCSNGKLIDLPDAKNLFDKYQPKKGS